MNGEMETPVVTVIWLLAFWASLVHVFVQSWRNKRVGYPVLHTLMVALVAWPYSYLGWILWWPGSLRQGLFGSDEERARRKVERMFEPGGRYAFTIDRASQDCQALPSKPIVASKDTKRPRRA